MKSEKYFNLKSLKKKLRKIILFGKLLEKIVKNFEEKLRKILKKNCEEKLWKFWGKIVKILKENFEELRKIWKKNWKNFHEKLRIFFGKI